MKNGIKMSPLGERGRPPSSNPKKFVIVFLVDKDTLAYWDSFQDFVKKRKKIKHKQDIFKFMIASGYKILS